MDHKTDPIIIDLLNWLKENLPPDVGDDAIFKHVKRVSKVFDTIVSLSFGEFYNQAMSIHHLGNRQPKDDDDDEDDDDCQTTPAATPSPPTISTLEEAVNERLKTIKDYINLNQEKQAKTKKLDASRAKLDLKKQQYQLITSIRLDGCMDLMSRHNHLVSKK